MRWAYRELDTVRSDKIFSGEEKKTLTMMESEKEERCADDGRSDGEEEVMVNGDKEKFGGGISANLDILRPPQYSYHSC